MERINFLPPWVETNLQPAFYDLESGTCLQQTARMYNKVNQLIRSVNEQNEKIADYIQQFIDLHEFVDDYFDNLDVQEEINNKLDEMAEDGSLTAIISGYVDPIYQEYQNNINANITNFESVTNAEIAELNAKFDSYSTTPLVVADVSEMTDTTKIYVNSTDGKWYYYDGDSWEIGGTYQSAGITTDKTLTEANEPADAKAVGDYILPNSSELKSINLIDGANNIQSGYTTAAGVWYASDTYYCLINPIDVHEYVGKTLYCSYGGVMGEGARYMRFICAYDEDGNVLSDKGSSSNTYTYTVPEGVYYINISTFAPTLLLQLEPDKITVRQDYFEKKVFDINDKVKTHDFDPYYKSLDIPTLDEQKSFEAIFNKNKYVIEFYGKISGAFTGLRLGQGIDDSKGGKYNIHITDTQLSYQVGTTDGAGVNHGLTIKDYIYARIEIVTDGTSHITIYTNGGAYTRNVIKWNGDSKDIFVEADVSTTITDAKLSYTAENTKKHIWYFGDSYTSLANTRFPYYLNELGFLDNIMLDGFAGAKDEDIYPDVTELFTNGNKPDCIIWALGMNDGDSSTINASWGAYISFLGQVCDENDVELILCTIPNTPSIDNSYKNAYIRSCGRRYVDYSKAVNTSINSSTWITGMLSNDNVHPTAEGARCLCSALISAVPEIMY